MSRYSNEQARGVLLEEAIAVLLRNAGFKIISFPGNDPTLVSVGAGVAVRGRGTDHQIDVVGDFPFVSPFANPSRLLVEGKFWKRTIGIDVVRNAAGVLKDVSEWFLPGQNESRRYHYQSAIFSASDFSEPAQHYAFAHDIVLSPLRDNALFAPVVAAIAPFDAASQISKTFQLRDLRELARRWLMNEGPIPDTPDELWPVLSDLREATVRIGQAYIARTSHGLPLFLVPRSRDTASQVGQVGDTQWMSVHYSRNEGWTIRTQQYGIGVEFAFDLPKELPTRLRPRWSAQKVRGTRYEAGSLRRDPRVPPSWPQSRNQGSYANHAGLIPRNPAVRAKPPRPKSQGGELRYWTHAELREFLGLVEGHRLEAAIHLLAMTGARRGEVAGLRWVDVDLDAARITIRQTLLAGDGEVYVSSPKSGRGRTVDLDKATVDQLREHRERQLQEAAETWRWEDSGYVFTRKDGSALNPSTLTRAFRWIVDHSELPRIRLHDLRHTHASIAVKAGVPIGVVSERLGHASPEFTMHRYSHVMPGMQREAADTIAKAVRWGGGS